MPKDAPSLWKVLPDVFATAVETMTGKSNRARARVLITAGAERDLAGIYNRRLVQRGPDGPDGAEVLLDDLVTAIQSLADFSRRGPVPQELAALGIHDFRQISHSPYRIIYLPEERAGRITVTVRYCQLN